MIRAVPVLIGIVLIVFPLISAFAWAAFDFRWWEPVSGNDVRMVALFFFHVLPPVVGMATIDLSGR